LEVAKLDQESVIENIELNTILSYLQVMYAKDQVSIAENKKAISTRQLEDSKKLVDAGSLPAGNLLALEAQIASDELNLVNARNGVAIAFLGLKNILQMEPSEALEIVAPGEGLLDEVLAARMPLLNEVIDAAIRNLPGIQRHEFALKSAETQVKITSGYGLPSLTLIGQLNTSYSNANIGIPGFEPDPYDVQVENNLGEVVGLNLSIPIFNNGQVAINRQNASLQFMNAELEQQIAINDLKTTVTEAWTGLQSAALTYDAALISLQSAQNAFDFAEAKFQAGASNSLDYTIAVNNLAQAEIALTQSKFDYIFKRKVIDYYMGNPIEF
jgi:outer membrane protein